MSQSRSWTSYLWIIIAVAIGFAVGKFNVDNSGTIVSCIDDGLNALIIQFTHRMMWLTTNR